MDLNAFYAAIGGDYNDVKARLQSDELIEKFLFRFIDDPSYSELKSALSCGDIAAAFRAAHTLKGVAATLGLNRLSESSSGLTEELRPLKSLPPRDMIEIVDVEYEKVIAALKSQNRE